MKMLGRLNPFSAGRQWFDESVDSVANLVDSVLHSLAGVLSNVGKLLSPVVQLVFEALLVQEQSVAGGQVFGVVHLRAPLQLRLHIVHKSKPDRQLWPLISENLVYMKTMF